MNEERRTTRGPGMWGGVGALTAPVQKAKNFRVTFFRFIKTLRPYYIRFLVVFVAAVLGGVFSVISPRLISSATTLLAGGTKLTTLIPIMVELAILYVFSSLFSYVQQYVMVGITQKSVYELRSKVNMKLARLPLRFFDGHAHGDIMSRFTNDFDNISNSMQQSLSQLISSIVTFFGVIAMMLTMSPLMTLVIFLTLPLGFIATKFIAGKSQAYFFGQQTALGALNGHVEEMYTGHLIVKSFGLETYAKAKFAGINDQLYESGWKAQFISGMIMPLMNFIGNIGYVFVTVLGGILVLKHSLPVGDIIAFILYARQFSQPITQLASIANVVQSTVASAERVFELLDEPEEIPEPTDAKVLTTARGAVRFEHVDFGYLPDMSIIKDLNITVQSGQTVAIVGPTGAGKTTLVNLLMRFYELDRGKITIDGINITELKRAQLRKLFGMVLQDTWLFHGTIRANIAYGRENASLEDVVSAAKVANANHFIRTLPDGYETELNEDASNLSLGQKQLLTIARAVLSDPPILILDEATSSVDTRTEIHIQQAMYALMKGRTSFVIAHRLSTIRGADLILVMDHGQVVEQGTHQELLERDGMYTELYHSQFADL